VGTLSIAELAATVTPPNATVVGPTAVVIQDPPVTLDANWAWPTDTATYFMYYTVRNASNQPIVGFQNGALLTEQPSRSAPPSYTLSSDLFPPTDTGFESDTEVIFPGGIRLRNVVLSSLAGAETLPADAGGAVIPTFSAQASFELSRDNGATWQPVTIAPEGTARAALTVSGGTRSFDTEMLQLDLSGGTLPSDLQFRESPSQPSLGSLTAIEAGSRFQISSFFDVFLEVSSDGGTTWLPAATPVLLDLAPPPVVTLNRSLNVVRVWTGQGVFANDFHIEFEARDAADLRFLDLDDVDPRGYFDGVFVTNRVVAFNALSNRVSITWYFPDTCFPGDFMPAYFGFTLFGGVRFRAVDWYWTYNGERLINYQDVWQDWIKNPLTFQLEDVIQPRPIPTPPPPPFPPTPVTYLSRITGSQPSSLSIAELAVTAVPPNAVDPDPVPVAVTLLEPVSYAWAWPGGDPTYFMYYDLLDEYEQPVAGFQNACILTPRPTATGGTPVATPTDAFPTPDGVYGAAPGAITPFGAAGWVRNFSVALSGPGGEPPPAGDAVLRTVAADVSFQLNVGGDTLNLSVPAQPTFRAASAGVAGGARLYDTELVDLSLDPAALPPGIAVRESPSKASLGSSSVLPQPGTYRIDSFFDVFLEVSSDGGATWTPASAPVRVTLTLPAPPATPVTLNRSLNTVRVWNQPGMLANDFHIEFVARDLANGFIDLNDLDPFGYVGTIATNRIVTFDALTKRVSITWQFADICVTNDAPAFFGFTVFGGIRYEAVDWYWTRDGVRIWSYEDVWQDWIKFNGSLRDVIVRRTPVIPPPLLPMPVRAVSRTVGTQPAPVTAAVLATLVQPPNSVWPDPGPVAFSPTVTNLVAEWAWPGSDPSYFVFYDLLDDAGAPIAGFQNASTLVAPPASAGETPQFAATDLFPPPTLRYKEASGEPMWVTYGGIRWTRDFTVRALSPGLPLPPPGEASLATFPAVVCFDVSSDGGSTWQSVSASAEATARIVATGLTGTFDAELLGLDLASSDLPAGLRLREAPTLPSQGRTTVTPVADGYMIDSFFDVFLECSVNGGGTWLSADRAARLAVQPICAETTVTESSFLPNDTYGAGRSPYFAFFPEFTLTDFTMSHFTHASAWPLPGVPRSHAFMGRVGFNINWPHSTLGVWATLRAEVTLTHLATDGDSQVYDAWFTRFDLYGGSLPDGLLLRLRSANPGDASGCATVRPDGAGGYRLCSFFDVWLEVSSDGGTSWTSAQGPSGLNIASSEINGSVIETWVDPVTRRALVLFSAPMGSSALNPDNYSFDGYTPASVQRLGDGRGILATLPHPPLSPCQAVIQSVYDAEGGLMQPSYFAANARQGLIQTHDVAAASLTVGQPDNPPEHPGLRGSSVVLIEVPQSGHASDSDADGLDDAPARVLDVSLASADGRYALRSNGSTLVFGSAEELANPVNKHLDVPPFGNGQGVLHIGQFNFIVEIEGVTYTPESGVALQGAFLDAYMAGGESLGWSTEPPYVPLLDGEGSPSGYTLGGLTLLPDLPAVSLSFASGGAPGELRWPKPSTNLRVQVATSLSLQDWVTIDPSEYVDEGTYWSYPITFSETSGFYRLRLLEE
jgi:hypothetical protein